jgi:hypothetical protein
VPADIKLTVPAETEHTRGELVDMVTGRPELAVAVRVIGADPRVMVLSGPNEIV